MNRAPVTIILDTDMDTDCDDMGALAVLHALADKGEATIAAIICDVPTKWGIPCIAAVNSYYGRPDIPLGLIDCDDFETNETYELYRKHLAGFANKPTRLYNRYIAETFSHADVLKNQVNDAVKIYRKVLAMQPDQSVVICAIGLLTVLSKLMSSKADEFSPLNGIELIRAKVKELVTMGKGHFPEGQDTFNWRMDPTSAEHVLHHWPSLLTVSAYGQEVLSGTRLYEEAPEDHPVRVAYELYMDHSAKPRPSWDQLAVLYAVRQEEGIWRKGIGYRIQFDASTSFCRWEASTIGGQHYIVPIESNDKLSEIIDELMIHKPQYMERIFRDSQLQGGTITSVQMMPAGSFTLPDGRTITDLPAFCRVVVNLKPTPNSNINAEIWLPQENWNGRFLGDIFNYEAT
jgi:pyrimidine-specific ribonucleoside hydrolase